MSQTLSADITFLQRAADTAGLVLEPGRTNLTFRSSETARLIIPFDTLQALALEMDSRRETPRDYRLIDYPAVWLLQAAAQLILHRADGNEPQAERYRKLAEHLRREVEADLFAARKTTGEIE